MDYKAQRTQTVNDIQTKSDKTRDNIFLKPKDDQTYGEGGWMTVWRLDTGEQSDSEERHNQDGGSNRYNLGRYHQGAKKCKSRR